MEVTAQLFRALACPPRIRILRLLSVLDECYVTELAEATNTPLCNVSAHMRTLSASGLVWRRRSGRIVYYRLAEQPSNPLTRGCLELLRSVFSRVRVRNPKRIASFDQAKSDVFSDAALFLDCTAFTHTRRLQITRYLSEQGPTAARLLATRLSMSPPACQRHVEKLERRGFLIATKQGHTVTCALADELDPVQKTLLTLVLERLTAPSL